MYPGSRHRGRMSRRDFLRRSAGAAVALPSAAAILAACQKPGQPAEGAQRAGIGGLNVGGPYPLARQDAPVTWTIFDDNQAIADDLPVEKDATLLIYNWSYYMWKKVVEEFADIYGVKWDIATFTSTDESIAKMEAGQVADVFFPTPDLLGKLVAGKLIRPLNHSYIPHIKDHWTEFVNPFYDQEWRYTVPYTIYTTGIAYRRDRVSDEEMAAKGYDIYWDPPDASFNGKISIYNDKRETLGMAMLRMGYTDVNTDDPDVIDQAKEDILEFVNTRDGLIKYNGAFHALPQGEPWIAQSWSGDIVYGANVSLPSGVSPDVLGFWYPPDGGGMIGNDCLCIPKNAPHPVLAHKFLDFWISRKYATENFTWNGYQPPLNSIKPDSLIDQGFVAPSLAAAVVESHHFDTGHFLLEVTPEVEQLYFNAWQQIRAGAES